MFQYTKPDLLHELCVMTLQSCISISAHTEIDGIAIRK